MGTVLVFIYAIFLIWLGLRGFSGFKNKAILGVSQDAFFVNERKTTAFGIGFSIIVSCVGASATLGMVGLAFQVGIPAIWWLGAGSIGLIAMSLFLAIKVRESGSYTMPELINSLLGARARSLISIIIVVAWMAILAAQFVAIKVILSALTGFPSFVCLGIAYLLIVVHSLGGQAAIMRVDKFQFFLIVISLLIILISINGVNPAWTQNITLELSNSEFPPSKVIYFLLVVGGNYLVCPMLFGRLLSAKNSKQAKMGGIVGSLGLMLCGILIVCIGLACVGFVPASTGSDDVLTTAISSMPSWVGLLI